MADTFDVLVVGAGPAGVAVAARLRDEGYGVVVLDRGTVGDGIARWPYQMRFFSTTDKVELPGYPLITTSDKPSREEYLNYLRRYVRERVKDFRAFHTVTRIEACGEVESVHRFRVVGVDRWGTAFVYSARHVVVATGSFDDPNMLGCPGEDLPKVTHWFTEIHPYAMHRAIVVGGKNSAAEVALQLWRAGAEVTLVHRGPAVHSLKFWIGPDLENRIKSGEIRAFFNTRIAEIRPHDVVLTTQRGEVVVENDFVIAMTGYRPDIKLLTDAGVRVAPDTRRPDVNPETLETNVPGLYVAGCLLAGDIAGEIFIENSRGHGELVLRGIRGAKPVNV